jgi:hypothetical protein
MSPQSEHSYDTRAKATGQQTSELCLKRIEVDGNPIAPFGRFPRRQLGRFHVLVECAADGARLRGLEPVQVIGDRVHASRELFPRGAKLGQSLREAFGFTARELENDALILADDRREQRMPAA